MPVPDETELTREQRLALTAAVAEFNRGQYFECHETLEEVWASLHGPCRDFFQGLIQISVGFHHLRQGNRAGALKTFTRALGRLEFYPARYLGFDLSAERGRLQTLVSMLTGEGVAVPEKAPTWQFDDSPAAREVPAQTRS